MRNDAKRQRKVFQDFRREKDELQKKDDKQHAELLEAKSRQATLKLRVGALQTASQSKSPRREVVEKDRLRAEEDAQRKRTDEALGGARYKAVLCGVLFPRHPACLLDGVAVRASPPCRPRRAITAIHAGRRTRWPTRSAFSRRRCRR